MVQAFVEADATAPCEFVFTRTDQNQFVQLERFDVEPVRGGTIGENADVRQPVEHRAHDVATELLLDVHADIGVPLQEARQRSRQKLGQRRHVGPQPYMAARAACVLLQLAAELLEPLKQAYRVLQRDVAGGCQHDAPRGAMQQRRAGSGLELGQAPARRREREAADLGTLGDAAGLGDRTEKPQRQEIHTRGIDGR